MSDNPPWLPGQRATIDRRTFVTIDRVTPSGRAVVGERTFDPNGNERGRSGSWRCARLEHLTPEIEAETALVVRGRAAREDAYKAIETATSWLRLSLDGWSARPRLPKAADIDRAERMVAAIRQVMEGAA